MAKQYVDASLTDTRDGMSIADGTGLTLTNSVRLLYDDTMNTSDLVVLIDKIRDKIVQNES